jgi:trimethylamine:corrinoid methyltransferase-like protein
MTKLAHRQSFAERERRGHEGMAERSIIETEKILAEHEVPPLDSYQELQLDEIMEAAAVELE